MTTYNTRNPIGSTDPRDLYDNSQNLDELINARDKTVSPDRFGVKRKTWHGIEQEAQLQIDRAEQAADDAVAAAGAIGPIKFYGNFADAVADLSSLTDGDIVEVIDDETKDGDRTRYRLIDGDFVFLLNLDKIKHDLAALNGASMIGFSKDYLYPESTVGAALKTAGGVFFAKDFQIYGDGSFEQSKLQSLINMMPDDAILDLCGLKVFLSKGDAIDEYPDGDQPCVVALRKRNITIRNGELHVTVHGLGAIDFYECEGFLLEPSVKISGPGLDKIPPIDGTTGRAEKGAPTPSPCGYYNPTLYTSTVKRNNSLDTSGFNTGGYGGAFPQWGGGTAPTWGVWNGGFIGNYGMGIGIIGGRGVIQCESTGFNGSGVWMHRVDDVLIYKAKLHSNYSAGYECTSSAGGGRVRVFDSDIDNNGHPNASPLHDFVDPGYGGCTNNGPNPHALVHATFNRYKGNKRKSIDAHSYRKFVALFNDIEGGCFGVYAAANAGSKAEFADIRFNTARRLSPSVMERSQGFIAASYGSTDKPFAIIEGNHAINCGFEAGAANELNGFYAVHTADCSYSLTRANTVINLAEMVATMGVACPHTTPSGNMYSICTDNTVVGKFRSFGIFSEGATGGIADRNFVDMHNPQNASYLPIALRVNGSAVRTGKANTLKTYRTNSQVALTQESALGLYVALLYTAPSTISVVSTNAGNTINATCEASGQDLVISISGDVSNAPRLISEMKIAFSGIIDPTGNDGDKDCEAVMYGLTGGKVQVRFKNKQSFRQISNLTGQVQLFVGV